MRTLGLTTVALMYGTSVFAQSPIGTPVATGANTMAASTYPAAPAGGQEVVQGPATRIIALGDHYTVHRVMPDGTVMVKTLTGEEAKMAMSGQTLPALAEIMAVTPQQTASTVSMTTGAGAAASTAGADAAVSTDTTITTGTSVPTTSATINSMSPTGVGATTGVTTPATDIGTTPTPTNN